MGSYKKPQLGVAAPRVLYTAVHAHEQGQVCRLVCAYVLALGALQILQLVGTLLLLHHSHKG